jgi:hypothetical protein
MVIGTTVDGVHSGSDKISYNFTLTDPGLVTIKFSAETDINKGSCYHCIAGVGLVGTTVSSGSSLNGKFSVSDTMYLESGDYSFNCSYTGNGTYTIESTFERVKSSFDDPNGTNGHTIETANDINLSETYYGLIMDGDDKDLYRFTLAEASTINMYFNFHTTRGRLYYRIYDKELNLIKSRQLDYLNASWGTGSSKNYFDNLTLDAGDYYLQVTGDVGGGAYDFSFHCAHNWDAGVVTKESTCADAGVKTFTCSSCNANKTEEIPKITVHDFGEWTMVDGEGHERVCTICEEKESSAHNWDAGVVTKESTCADAGVKTFTCSSCNANKTEEIPKLSEHDFGAWTTVDGESHERVCAICQEKESSAHNWDAGVVTKESTCAEVGVKTFTCSSCNANKTEEIPKLIEQATSSDKQDSNNGCETSIAGSSIIITAVAMTICMVTRKKENFNNQKR